MLSKTISLKNSAIVLATTFVVAACSGNQGKKENTDLTKEDTSLVTKIEKVVYEIPAPSEIPYLLENTGVEFDASLLHPTSAVNRYVMTNKSALNLGIYASNIGYLSTYGKVQEALDYMGKIRPLVDQLGLNASFDPALVQRFEANLSSKDSLSAIINEAVSRADDQLKKNERNNVAALILAGSFLEGLYISCALVENYPQDILPSDQRTLILVPLVRVILMQEKPLNDLIVMLKTIEQDEVTKELITRLESISAEYKKLNIAENMANNRGDLLLKDETLDQITNQAGGLRDFITN
jgi:hypothetical protein